MKLFRMFIGDRVIFPFQDVIGEGILLVVERTGYMFLSDVEIEGEPVGDLVIPRPEWLRRAVSGEVSDPS